MKMISRKLCSGANMVHTVLHVGRSAGPLTIMFPGYQGNVDGYSRKYLKIAQTLSEKVGSVLRCDNQTDPTKNYDHQAEMNFHVVMKYVRELIEIGKVNPSEIYMFGYSAGGSLVASLAHHYPEITRILLVAPSLDMEEDTVYKGLGQFSGRVYLVSAEYDSVVRPVIVERIANYAKEIVYWKALGCDHQFTGVTGGLILSSLFIWAFLQDKVEPYPNSVNGWPLYV